MKLKIEENLDQSLEKLIKRTQKPSFSNNKGLTKIQRFILLDTIDFIQNLEKKKGNSLSEG
ncbi:MAG TPA: hypothetical protein ENK66_08810 [Arcobacter sp.]|nr:hypothetical protein [Arcobacter sp.]